MKHYRLAKFISHSGYTSRRQAEQLISLGLVKVNNTIVQDCAVNVSEDDKVEVRNKQVTLVTDPKLWLYNKPRGVITTHSDPQKRRTVFETLPSSFSHVISVGRLDYNTEGLLLLTDAPKLAHYLEHPNSKMLRKYKCRAFGKLHPNFSKKLHDGLNIDGIQYGSIRCEILESSGNNVWLMLSLYEGKNREIRKIMQYFGLEVSRLIRVQYGKFYLNSLMKNLIIEADSSSFTDYIKDAYGK